jgi:hypothetical protein
MFRKYCLTRGYCYVKEFKVIITIFSSTIYNRSGS